MNNNTSFCYHQRHVFSPEECQSLIDLDIEQQAAKVLTREQEQVLEEKFRFSLIKNIPMAPEFLWIFERLNSIVFHVNQQYFNVEGAFLSPIQILEYPVGGGFNWHCDIGRGNTSQRKLSLVVFLSDDKSYGGGQLIIPQTTAFPQTQGTLVIFPSHLHHKVELVSRGVRHSLVTWVCGRGFK